MEFILELIFFYLMEKGLEWYVEMKGVVNELKEEELLEKLFI